MKRFNFMAKNTIGCKWRDGIVLIINALQIILGFDKLKRFQLSL